MMNLEQYKETWQAQELPQLDETALVTKTEGLSDKIAKQNRRVSLTLAGTIGYLLVIGGVFLRDNPVALILVALVIVLLVYQTLVLRKRSLAVERSLEAQPTQYLDQMIQKLRYNLKVSKLHMPIYGLLLGGLIGAYTWVVLGPTPNEYKFMAVGGTWIVMLGIFVWGMRRQSRKDREEIMPLLEELESMREAYSEKP